jgi:hypothetical protein
VSVRRIAWQAKLEDVFEFVEDDDGAGIEGLESMNEAGPKHLASSISRAKNDSSAGTAAGRSREGSA